MEKEVEKCSICFDEFKLGEPVRKLKCKHKFHKACIDPWLRVYSKSCPYCRQDLYTNDEILILEGMTLTEEEQDDL